MILKNRKFKHLNYCLWLPEHFNPKHKYPIVFFTHGAGTRGDDLTLLNNNPVLTRMFLYTDTDEVVICAPQCSENTWFDEFETLIAFAETIHEKEFVDQKKFYGVGVSMGGYAMLQLMQARPRLFTAGIICCGGGMYWNAERLKEIPLLLFHGEKDTVVFPEESRHMAEKITESGGTVALTVYPECGHDCWSRAFDDSENMKWLLKQEK